MTRIWNVTLSIYLPETRHLELLRYTKTQLSSVSYETDAINKVNKRNYCLQQKKKMQKQKRAKIFLLWQYRVVKYIKKQNSMKETIAFNKI